MTLKDVASKANCSVSTASKALKNSSEISEEAKQRILAVAKECGYFKKATTRSAILGGLKIVIFNDVKGNSVGMFEDIKKLAGKYGLTAIYVAVSEKDSLELLNQIAAFGLILKGVTSKKALDKVFVLENSPEEAKEFLKEISTYMPKRPSRANLIKENANSPKKQTKKMKTQNKEKTVQNEEKSEPISQKKEEIWLL